MNFCTKCGTKLDPNTNFCTNCGKSIGNNSSVTSTPKKEVNNTKVILVLGIFLVLFSTFALGIITWKNLNEILRICFFGFETVLFFILSFLLKKIDSKIDRVFFIIGLVLIPYTLSLLPYYDLLPGYFNQGAGLFIYLALLYLIVSILYFVINISFKSKFVNFLLLASLLISFIDFGIAFEQGQSIIALFILLYLILVYFISNLSIFTSIFKTAVKIFTSIVLGLIVPYLMFIFILYNNTMFDKVVNIGIALVYIIFGYIKIYKDNHKAMEVIFPITFVLLSNTLILSLLYDYEYINAYVITTVAILFSVISVFFNKYLFNLITSIFSYTTIAIILLIYALDGTGTGLIIVSSFLLLFNIFNIISKNVTIAHYFIPATIFFIVLGFINEFFNVSFIYVLLASVLIFLIIYVILKLCKSKYALTYFITALVLSCLSVFNINLYLFIDSVNNLANYGVLVELFLIFILSNIFKEKTPFNVISFVFLNIVSISVFDNEYYGLLIVSGATLVFSFIISLISKRDLKPYFLYSQITLFVITLFNAFDYSMIALIANLILYVLAYVSILKYNNNKVWRIFYIIVGFISIYKIFNIIFAVPTIASLISIIVIIIIIVILYLLEVESNLTLTLISLAVLIPYYNLVYDELGYLEELYVLPFVIYTFIFTEVINFKSETNRKLTTIIPISIFSLFIISFSKDVPSIIFDVIYSLLLIVLGLYRKYTYFIYFGVSLIVLTVLIQIFTILDSVALVIALIILGFILIGIGVYFEVKKNNKQ